MAKPIFLREKGKTCLKTSRLTFDDTTSQPGNALDGRDVVVDKVFVTGGVEKLTRVTEEAPQPRRHCHVVHLLGLRASVEVSG